MAHIDQSLLTAYLETHYQVIQPAFLIRVNHHHHALDQWLAEKNARSWAFISAWNPWSQRRSRRENDDMHQRLINACEPYQIFPARGEPAQPKDECEAEESLLILDIPRDEALALCERFQQNAIVYGERGLRAELLFNPTLKKLPCST